MTNNNLRFKFKVWDRVNYPLDKKWNAKWTIKSISEFNKDTLYKNIEVVIDWGGFEKITNLWEIMSRN